MRRKKPFVYMAVDEVARFKWLCSRYDRLRQNEIMRQSISIGPPEFLLEVGVVSHDTISIKAQLATTGTRRQLCARRDRMTHHLQLLGCEFDLVFRLFDRPTSTTFEYRASAADRDRFRTVRLTGHAARQAAEFDRL